ncbi:MAG: FliH/SctL family protein [Planctomycetota bacterium]|nr:FliH/SctL family protein [Planctomycetota bacterium]
MGVLRAAEAERAASGAIVLDLGDLKRQGQEIISRARREADRIVADARREREQLVSSAASEGREQGLRDGREQGLREGREAGRAEARAAHEAALRDVERRWREALESFSQRRDQLLLEAKTDVLRVAVRLGEKVTRRTIAAHPEACVTQVGETLAMIARPTRVLVLVHPEDEPLVRAAFPALTRTLGESAHAELRADDSVGRGGCIVRTAGGGAIDATIDTQLDRLGAALLGEDAP